MSSWDILGHDSPSPHYGAISDSNAFENDCARAYKDSATYHDRLRVIGCCIAPVPIPNGSMEIVIKNIGVRADECSLTNLHSHCCTDRRTAQSDAIA